MNRHRTMITVHCHLDIAVSGFLVLKDVKIFFSTYNLISFLATGAMDLWDVTFLYCQKKKNLCQCFDNFLLMHEHFDPYFTMSLYKRDFFSMFCIVLNFLDLCIKTYFIFHMLDLSPGI